VNVAAELAGRGESWGGPVVGLIAAIVFVVFSGWIVAQRLRAKETVQRVRTHRKDHDD
jgi:hypothetical protein